MASRNESRIEEQEWRRSFNNQMIRAAGSSPHDNRIENLEIIPNNQYNYIYTTTEDHTTIIVNPIEKNNFMSFSEWGRLGQYNNISDIHSCLLRFLFFDYYLMSFTKEFLKSRKDVNEMFRIFQKLNYSMDSMVKCVEYGVLNSCSLSDAKASLFPDNLSIENNHKRHVILPKDRKK